MELSEYRIRLDGTRDLDDRLVAFCKKRCDGYILVHHTTETENPHYHAWVRSSVSQGNLSNYLKKEFNVSKSDYSCKSCKTDRRLEFWSYLFNKKKGNVPALVNYDGVSVIDVKTAQETANQISIEFDTRIKNLKTTKMTKFDIAEKLSGEKFRNNEELFDAVVKLLHHNRMCSNVFVIKDIMSTTLLLNNDPILKERICNSFSQRGL